MKQTTWKVEGMTCANCALTIHQYLEKKGFENIRVNAIGGEVSFDASEQFTVDKIQQGIEQLGYHIVNGQETRTKQKALFTSHLQRFLFTLPFTAILMLHMIPGLHWHWLMNPWIQLLLASPVYIVGMSFFGKSAINSLRNGVPNMNVLIALGATAAFVYSLSGHVLGLGSDYLFYETAAAIITLVFLGNYLESASIASTQKALEALATSQKIMANMIAFDDQKQEIIFPVESSQLREGDLVLIKTGEQVPADCKILWGEAEINEAIITGESIPVFKKAKDLLIGGSIVENGTLKAIVTAAGEKTVLANILQMVKQAQGEKPPVQQLADRISAIFVPVVVGIAIITLVINWIVLQDFTPALLRSIAVLVIACPCAMGLATPAAIAVGLGRGARNGILFRNAHSLELFKDIEQVVFDKTGTLTTGNFIISNFHFQSIDEAVFKSVVYSLEKYSNHPIAKSIAASWKGSSIIHWKKVEEIKGRSVKAIDKEGNEYEAGSFAIATSLTQDDTHQVYVLKNKELVGWIDMQDELRPESQEVIDYFKSKKIKTILLSGDRYAKTQLLGTQMGIDEVIAEKTPAQKLEIITKLSAEKPTAMVGDGINDAPALAKATVGISMADASQVAMQSAQVVLINKGLKNLPAALGLGKHTYITIKQNLFWAFSYNIVAIPIAAMGFLLPAFAALVMAFSDVVLALNSGRLFVKKVV